MNISFPPWATAVTWLVTLLVPIALIVIAVRLLMTPLFLEIEYRMPNFPADRYGFTRAERLTWSRIALDYLLNDEGIEFLADLQFDDGAPVYNERELGHLVDVKQVTRLVLLIGYLALGGVVALGVWARLGGWWDLYRVGLGRGGWLTTFLVIGILLLVILAFGFFFVAFHNVFFEAGTWQFLYSDTLIRLFPERFWRDSFVWVGVFAAGAGALLGYVLGRSRPG